MKHPDRDDPRDLARRALAWFHSESGQESLKESERRVAETAALLEKGRDIDPAKLDEPFTV
jgi:hypothetical protein